MLLTFVTVFSMLPACSEPPSAPTPTPQSLSLVESGASAYRIVYGEDSAGYERKLAIALRDLFKSATGVSLPVQSDNKAASTPAEILVGKTNRAGQYAAEELAYGEGYSIYTAGERVILEVGSYGGAYLALCRFAKDALSIDLERGETANASVSAVTLESDYRQLRFLSSGLFPYLTETGAAPTITYQQNDYIQKRMAIRLYEQIKMNTGVSLGLDPYNTSPDSSNLASIEILEDASLTNGDWRMTCDGNIIRVSAGDYNGFISAIRAFSDQLNDWNFYPVRSNDALDGSYLDMLTVHEEATRYAYTRTGEHRILFNNILFHNGTGTRPNQPYDVPVGERNRLQAAMVALYRPDVLALQEVANSKRAGAGEDNIITLLSELGYVETVDPRVENSKTVEDGGWGLTGWKVTDENGREYYTSYNMDPLLYNTATTRCIESEYLWFRAHQDAENANANAGEFATKASTWGVFESIATGEKYIVMSVHMTGASQGVQLLQTQEIAEKIEELVAKYHCPVFMGGDFNGNLGDANYTYLTGDGGYKSLQDDRIATLHTSPTRTTHGYPRYDETLGIMTDGGKGIENAVMEENQNSIDQVYVKYLESTEIHVFGVIADECSLSASDHLPMLVDFSIE